MKPHNDGFRIEICDYSRLHWHIGYAYGLLNGISLRGDVPEEVREKCKQAVKEYEEEMK